MNQKIQGNEPKAMDKEDAARGAPSPETAEAGVRIHGFQQVLEMLRIADPEFRESLLKRLAARDSRLARALREDLAKS